MCGRVSRAGRSSSSGRSTCIADTPPAEVVCATAAVWEWLPGHPAKKDRSRFGTSEASIGYAEARSGTVSRYRNTIAASATKNRATTSNITTAARLGTAVG